MLRLSIFSMKMTNFPGNLSWKIRFQLQNHIFSIPWLRKNNIIRCTKDRTYSSSFPVRYIPKKSLEIEESSNSSPVKHSEFTEKNNIPDSNALRSEVSHGGRNVWSSIASNEKFLNNLKFDDAELEVDHDLEALDSEFMEEPEEEFPHQGEDCQSTECITSQGLINDFLYAETFSRSRWSSLSWGPRRIKQALFKKGISEVDVEKAVKLVFQDGESGGDQEPRHGLSKLSMDHLFVQASKQWLRGQNVPKETQKSRIIRWLQYRGFNWGVISFILKKLESQYPP
ncbi:hypothetical protein L1049_000414 [Liquidambar formosana]|uniref:Regulatory protein RecX n=1 Tax=Liquidambar formosana TaxID=63359 RepID=A0AAP0NAJ4_LIQFO